MCMVNLKVCSTRKKEGGDKYQRVNVVTGTVFDDRRGKYRQTYGGVTY